MTIESACTLGQLKAVIENETFVPLRVAGIKNPLFFVYTS